MRTGLRGSASATFMLAALLCIACAPSGGAIDLGGTGGEPPAGDGAQPGVSGGAGGSVGPSESGGAIGAGGLLGTGGMEVAGSSTGGVDTGAPGGTWSGGTSSGGAGSGGSGSGGAHSIPSGLSWPTDWPVDCVPESTCYALGYPDADDDGQAFDCGDPGYQGHEGTDIPITWEQMDAGVAVRAAADGVVFFASDGKFDRCPDDAQPDCQQPPSYEAGSMEGTTVCTELGPYCNPPGGSCFWCFAGGNVVVILHDTQDGVFATRYDHLKNGSVLVAVGETVSRGQAIAQIGSAGNSTGPHLHFEVWGSGYYDVVEPWAGACGPNTTGSLWAVEPPWEE